MSSCSPRHRMIEDHMYLVPITAQRLIPPHLGAAFREDAEGEGYLALVKAADRYDPKKGVFRSWAITCIRGRMREFLRKEDPLPRYARERGEPEPIFISLNELLRDDDDGSPGARREEVIPSPGPTPEEEVLERLEPEPSKAGICLRPYLDRLPERERLTVWARVGEGRSSSDIAEEMGRRHSTVIDRTNRALLRLREMMAADGVAP